jgi:hypothetical protein
MMPDMDPKRTAYSLKAPGRSDSGIPQRLPGGPLPRVDDHLVVPEITRDEIIGGRRMVAHPAHPPHATRHTELDYVIRAHVAPGYHVAADLLTRHDQDSDFASDVCVFKDGVDPATGARYLEEIAFEVVSEQRDRLATEKAARMQRRGVRRVFAVWVKERRVCEWSAEVQTWRVLDADSWIEDSCFVRSFALAALLDAAAADRSVVEALAAKDSPAILERDALARAKGVAEGVAESIFMILEERDIAMNMAQRQEILGCHDRDRLNRWLRKAMSASSTEEITSEP